MRRDKRAHWHVDQLTEAGKVVGAWVFPGRGECEVNDELADWPTPIEGFGSSDCRRCRAHLRFWAPGRAPAATSGAFRRVAAAHEGDEREPRAATGAVQENLGLSSERQLNGS